MADANDLSADEILSRIAGGPVPTLDIDGNQIPGLEGLMFKPIETRESIEIEQKASEHKEEPSYGITLTFIYGLIRPNGTRVFTEEHIPRVEKSLGGIVSRSLQRIRSISGKPDSGDEGKEKKIALKRILDSNSPSDSPKASPAPSESS